jgi:hypothetical protein
LGEGGRGEQARRDGAEDEGSHDGLRSILDDEGKTHTALRGDGKAQRPKATISRAPCAGKTTSYLFIRERRSRALQT